jgi:FAD/FMN-containing dehydrogenase
MPDSVVSQTGAAVNDAAVSRFSDTLRGELLRPGNGRYEDARRIWNALIDKRPGLIARCADADDVAHSVRFAREHELELSVRGGGHNIAGKCVSDGGLMLDCSQMKQIDVDPERYTARAQPGLNLGEFDRATQVHGLATTMGIASTTGIAGLTVGGGYGWLAGRYGLACDNLTEVELVTADGELVRASGAENPELFWGVRGGGGNFGVVTSFEYRLHPLGNVLGGMVLYAPTKDALTFFDEFSHNCPDEVCTLGLLTSAPDGSLAFAIAACHCGPIEAGEKALAPLRSFGPPLADMIEPRDYVEMQCLTDEAWPPGRLYYWKSSLVRSLSEGAIEVLLDYASRKPTTLSAIGLQQLHGAASCANADGAFPHRFEHYNCIPLFETEDPADVEAGTEWARGCWQAMQPFAAGAAYVNDLGEEGEERVQEAYGPSLERLRALKTTYDPTNFFHLNQNITPATTSLPADAKASA